MSNISSSAAVSRPEVTGTAPAEPLSPGLSRSRYGFFVAGAFLGFTIGFLFGFYVTDVIGSTLVGIAALAGGIVWAWRFGFVGQRENEVPWQALGFGLLCTIGVSAGILVRTHSLLAVPLSAQLKELKDAGFPDQEARDIVSIRRFGVQFQRDYGSPTAQIPRAARPPSLSESPAGNPTNAHFDPLCERLAASRFNNVGERLAAFRDAGGQWTAMATVIATIDAKRRAALLDTSYNLVCRPPHDL
jgi:hypothetical protein